MKCPNCDHVSETVLLQCSKCGEAFDRHTLENLEHLRYLLFWLDARSETFADETIQRLQDEAHTELQRLLEALLPAREAAPAHEPAAPAPVTIATAGPVPALPLLSPPAARQLALLLKVRETVSTWLEAKLINLEAAILLHDSITQQAQTIHPQAGDAGRELPELPEDEIYPFTLKLLDGWAAEHLISDSHAELLRGLLGIGLEKPAPAGEVALLESPVPTEAIPAEAPQPPLPAAPAPRPAPPLKPARPPIRWDRAWEKTVEAVVSGTMLRGLLYLGAFMIIVSASVLVARFWEVLPPLLQAGFIFAVPTIFYLGGWGVRTQLRLPQAGNVLTGIGAVLLAVDFAAIYQFGGLRLASTVYWLSASIICTSAYTITAWRLKGEFFLYLTLLGGSSVVLAITRLLWLPLEWSIAAFNLCGFLMLAAAARLKGISANATERWADFTRASRILPQIIFPITLALILFVPGDPAAGQSAAFLLAAFGYGLLAWAYPAAIFAHAALWSSLGGAVFVFHALAVPLTWYPSAAALLSPVYVLLYRLLSYRLPDDFSLKRLYMQAPQLTGFTLLGLAILGGIVTMASVLWPPVVSLTLVSLVMAGYAPLLRQPLFVLAASVMFLLPYSLAINHWLASANGHPSTVWLAGAWTGLGLVYLGLTAGLRRLPGYSRWLALLAHLIAPVAISTIFFYVITNGMPASTPLIAVLSSMILIYLLSVIMHDGDGHPALSAWVDWLPVYLRRAVFLYPLGVLIPVWVAVAWRGSVLSPAWLGVALAVMALSYAGAGQVLGRRRVEYRFPSHLLAYALGVAAILASFLNQAALMTALYLNVVLLAWMALIYHNIYNVWAAGLLFLWPFQLSLNLLPITPHGYSLAYALMAGLGYTPLGLWLRKRKIPDPRTPITNYGLPVLMIGYGFSFLALAASLLGRFGGFSSNVVWVGALVPLSVTALYIFSARQFRVAGFAWAATATFLLAFWQGMTWVRLAPEYEAAAWVLLGVGHSVLSWRFFPRPSLDQSTRDDWWVLFRVPMRVGAWVTAGLGVGLTAPLTLTAFRTGLAHLGGPADLIPVILAQGLGAGFVVLSAWLSRSKWPLFLEPGLIFLPVTLAFIGWGERMFGELLPPAQFGVLWAVTGLAHVLIAARLDEWDRGSRSQRAPTSASLRSGYAHGIYLGGYGLVGLGMMWASLERASLLWALGVWIVLATGSAWLTHAGRHYSWDDFIRLVLGGTESIHQRASRGAFIWLAVWPFPVWVAVLLRSLNVVPGFELLGYSLSALTFLGLAFWLRPLERTYPWPFIAASQFFTFIALLQTATPSRIVLIGQHAVPGGQIFLAGISPVGLVPFVGYLLVQAMAVLYYSLSGLFFRVRKWSARLFSYAASGLSFVPYTLAWLAFRFDGADFQMAYAWIGLAAALLGVGYMLDGRSPSALGGREGRVGFAHGPYLVGYLVAIYALFYALPDRLVTIYTMAGVIVLALWSHAAVHYGRHATWVDLSRRFLGEKEGPAPDIMRSAFLWLAAYSFPVWLALVLAYNEVTLAWRGLALALAAPLYIAFGLAIRRARREDAWPLYSAGYALTAIGTMVSFENQLLAIYTLSLNAVVYAVSAYIFQQGAWLYLSNVLVPVIGLMGLDYRFGDLLAVHVAWWLMGVSLAYFGLGRWFDRKTGRNGITTYSLPFYAPGYLLSAVALAVASGERSLTIQVYLVGVLLYAVSAWVFREAVFLFPAVWLTAVPYYLGMTYTHLAPVWYGIGWLPLIVASILAGKFVFHKTPIGLVLRREGEEDHIPAHPHHLASILAHPAMPFYSLAYALSLSMIFIARGDFSALAVAFGAAAALYLASAGLYRQAWWLYPGLLAGHLGLLTYLAIDPSGAPVRYLTLPFHGVTWLMGLLGGLLKRREIRIRQFGFFPKRRQAIGTWATPFLVFAALDVVVWQIIALFGWETGIIVAAGHSLLLGLVAMMWMSKALVWGSLGFLSLGIGLQLGWLGLPLPVMAGTAAGVGFGLYLAGRLVESVADRFPYKETASPNGLHKGLSLWVDPLTRLGMGINAIGVLVTLPFALSQPTAVAAGLAFAGSLYLAVAYRGRYHLLGYAAVAALEMAFVMVLVERAVREPQWYALPAGLYFTGMGVFERRRGRERFALLVESLGLTALLLTTFIQSIDLAGGFQYFLLLVVEGLLVMGWGAQQRRKVPFLAGIGASALNVAGQMVVLFIGGSTLTRWVIFGGLGLLLLMAALLAERWIIPRAQEMRRRLEEWA